MNILDLDANFHLLNVYICFVFQIARLETDNSKLRQRINMYEDSAKAMVGADDLDEVTKAELLEKYSKNFLVFKRERRKSGPGGVFHSANNANICQLCARFQSGTCLGLDVV